MAKLKGRHIENVEFLPKRVLLFTFHQQFLRMAFWLFPHTLGNLGYHNSFLYLLGFNYSANSCQILLHFFPGKSHCCYFNQSLVLILFCYLTFCTKRKSRFFFLILENWCWDCIDFFSVWVIWFDIWKYHSSTDTHDKEIWLYKDRLLLDDILKFVKADIDTKMVYCTFKGLLISR